MTGFKQKSINAVTWTLMEKYGVQIFNVIIGVLLARLLSPEDFGVVGMITVFFTISMIFVNSGFSAAYIQKENVDDLDASTIFYFNLISSIFLYGVLWFAATFIASFYGLNQLTKLIRVTALVIIINSFSMMQISILTRQVNFKRKTIISLVSTLISGIISIVLALKGFGVWSLVNQILLKAFLNSVGLWLFYNWRPRQGFSIDALKKFYSFSIWILFTGLLKGLFDNIYILVIGKFYPISQLGYYSNAKKYQSIVYQQPSSAIGSVAFPVFSKFQNDTTKLKNSLRRFIQHSLFYLAPLGSILFVNADPLINLVLKQKWMPMVPYFQILLVIGLFYPFHLLNLQLLQALGKSKLNFNISLFKNSLRLINIILLYNYGIIFILYGELVVSVISLFINAFYTKKLINYGALSQLKDSLKTFSITAVSALFGFLLLSFLQENMTKIILGFLSIISVYSMLQFIFNKLFFLQNIQIIRERFLVKL